MRTTQRLLGASQLADADQLLPADSYLHPGSISAEPLEIVQVPAQPRDDRRALGDKILAVVDQQLQLTQLGP